MPSTDQSWLLPGLRFCVSCLVSLLYWSVWIILSVSLAGLIYILVSRELPVPDFLLRQIESQMAEANFTIKFGRARLDSTGIVLLEDVQVRSRQFPEPLLKSRLIFVKQNIWSVLAGRPIPDEIRLEGAMLQLPAILSPSGSTEPIVRDLTAVLRHEDKLWHVDQLNASVGHVRITIQGDWSAVDHARGKQPVSPEEMTKQFLQLGRRVIIESNQLDAFSDPALSVRLENKPGIGNIALCTFSASGARQPWAQPLNIGALLVATTLRLNGEGERTVRMRATARSVTSPGQYDLTNVSAVVSAHVNPGTFSVKPVEALLAAGLLRTQGEQIAAPMVRANLESWPTVKLATSVQIGKEIISAQIDAAVDKKSAQIALEGTGSPEIINRVLAKHLPRAAPYFLFGDPVTVTATAVLSPGWQFDRMSSRVVAGRINSHGVFITAARGRIDIKGMDFLAYDARVEMDENVARGSYWMNFSTTDYRMLLKGRLLPPKISGWFNGDWWADFWNEHFDFRVALPVGDVDVQGRWKDISHTEFFGHAEARKAGVWGGVFDRAEAGVFLRPHFAHVIKFDGERAAGTQLLSGSLKHIADSEARENSRVEFNLQGNVDPETYHGMLDGKADEVLATLQFSAPPHVRAQGAIDIHESEGTPEYTFTGQTEGAFRYYGFPLESARVTGRVKGENIQLDDIQLTALGGKGAGQATLTGSPEFRQLGFNLYLNGADLGRTIKGVQEYQAANGGEKNGSTADSSFIKRATGGRFDVALSAQGIPGELKSFVGTGNAALTGADLGEIQLFGLLSQALSGLSLNFSSLKLDAAHTSFRLENSRLRFSDLKVTGPSAVIDARGEFSLETTALDFTAKFKPFEENKTLLTTALGIVINPITSILELKLTGPLNKPHWSIDLASLLPKTDNAAPPKEKTSETSTPPAP